MQCVWYLQWRDWYSFWNHYLILCSLNWYSLLLPWISSVLSLHQRRQKNEWLHRIINLKWRGWCLLSSSCHQSVCNDGVSFEGGRAQGPHLGSHYKWGLSWQHKLSFNHAQPVLYTSFYQPLSVDSFSNTASTHTHTHTHTPTLRQMRMLR